METRSNHPESPERLKDKALRLKKEKQYSEAFACFGQLLETDPQNDFYLSNMAHIQYLLQRYIQAKQLAQQAISSNPQNTFAIGVLGEIALKNNEYQEARRLFEDAFHLNPNDIYYITRLAYACRKCEKITVAINLLKENLLKYPEESKLYQHLGDIYKSLDKFETARENYRQAVNFDPKNGYAFMQWVSCLEANKSKADIIREIKKLLSVPSQEDNQFLRSYYAKLLTDSGKADESRQILESAVSADPRSLYRKTRLAASYNRQALYQKAIDILKSDYENNVANPYLFYELANAFFGLGNKNRAREVVINGLKNFKDNKYLRRLLMKLR